MLYPLYSAALALVMFAAVPKEKIRRLVPFAVLYGSVGDALWLLILGFFNLGGYINYGPFAFLGMPFFPLLAWTFFFTVYLYFLPDAYPWNYIFTLAATGYSLLFSNVLQNLGIFQWTAGRFWIPLAVYLIWMTLVTYTYQHYLAASQTHL